MIRLFFDTYLQNGFVKHRNDYDCSVSSSAFWHSWCLIDSVLLLSCCVQQPLKLYMKQMSQSRQLLRSVLHMLTRTTLSIMSCVT